MRNLFLAIVILTILLPSNLFAQDFFESTTPKGFVGVEYGWSKVDNNTQQLADLFVDELGGRASVTQDTSVGIGRVFAGYWFVDMLGAEVGYFQTSDIRYRLSGTTSSAVAYTSSGDLKYKGWDYSLLLRPAPNVPVWKGLYFKAGGHNTKTDLNFSIALPGLTYSTNINDSGSGTLYGAGYDWALTNNVFGRVAVTHFNKLAGESEDSATAYSVGVGLRF